MQIIKTQKIICNHELRIRLITDNENTEYLRLIRLLPDSRWSANMNSWHIRDMENHIGFLNKVFPSEIRFYDISKAGAIPNIEEKLSEKRICITKAAEENKILLKFLYNKELASLLIKLKGNTIPGNKNTWEVKNSPDIKSKLFTFLKKSNYLIDYPEQTVTLLTASEGDLNLSRIERKFRTGLESLSYKPRTINQYVSNVSLFLRYAGKNPSINPRILKEYIEEIAVEKKYSRSYLALHMNSIKAYYRIIRGVKSDFFEIPRPRRSRTLPVILSRHEVSKILQHIPNIKHSVLIRTIYITGITVSEAASLRPGDVNITDRQIIIRGRKSKADRKVAVSDEYLKNLKTYMNCFQPVNYLFEGYGRSRYSERSIQKVLKKYVRKAGIEKKATVYTLRHSCAGHLAAEGIGTDELQTFLGLSDRRSVEVYRKVACL